MRYKLGINLFKMGELLIVLVVNSLILVTQRHIVLDFFDFNTNFKFLLNVQKNQICIKFEKKKF